MKIAIFGLSLSSSWGNGHATTWRALVGALAKAGHKVTFFERDVPWYRENRDMPAPDDCKLVLYDHLARLEAFGDEIGRADVVIVGSYVPEGRDVIRFALGHARGVTCFYDIDTPVTLEALGEGTCEYLDAETASAFDIYFSFSGGRALDILRERHGVPHPVALYCSVNTAFYRPLPTPRRWALGYIGTYSEDRQAALERLLLEPARQRPDFEFVVAGPMYPDDIDWPQNVMTIAHVPPASHPAFYCQCGFALNVTRRQMTELGHSPSVRLFESAACGVPAITDRWEGIGEALAPGEECIVADTTQDVLEALSMPEGRRTAIGKAARERAVTDHSAIVRARTLIEEVQAARARRQPEEAAE